MRLVVISNYFPSVEQPQRGVFVLRQLQALQRIGFEASVLQVIPIALPIGAKWRSYHDTPTRYVYEGIEVESIRAVMLPRRWGLEFLPLQVYGTIRKVVASKRPTLIHAHGLIPAGSLVMNHGYPSVVTAHGTEAYALPKKRSGLRELATRVVRSATKLVAVSDFVRQELLALAQRDVDVVFNGADESLFVPGDRLQSRTELGLPLDRPIVAFVGQVTKSKGIFELLAALRLLQDLRPLCVIAGEGGDPSVLANVRKWALDCRFMGVMRQSRLVKLYQAADVVTLPSHHEGLPASLCEAMVVGRAVVATRVGGIPEIVKDGVTGILVPKQDEAALAKALRRVLVSLDVRDAYERYGRTFALKSLTWRINAQSYASIFEQAIRMHVQHGEETASKKLGPGSQAAYW